MKLSLLCTIPAVVLSLSGLALAQNFTKGKEQKVLAPELSTGDYVWKPEISPAGPVVIVACLPEQTMYVYRNGVRIGRSTFSSGKPGHQTPTGVFTILQKKVKHTSSIYKGASMPYMERLTWDGIAMHAGNLPGHPASHGCLRLPLDFAQKLYTVTSNGSTVIITDGKAKPTITSKPGLLLKVQPDDATTATVGEYTWNPEKSPDGPVTILFSSADCQAYVFRNGVEIGRAAVRAMEEGVNSFGSHVYSALADLDGKGNREWSSLGSADGTPSPNLKELTKQLVIPPVFLAEARAIVVPGTTIVVTDQPVDRNTKSKPGFNIITAANTPAS